jgi:hypothetical protein
MHILNPPYNFELFSRFPDSTISTASTLPLFHYPHLRPFPTIPTSKNYFYYYYRHYGSGSPLHYYPIVQLYPRSSDSTISTLPGLPLFHFYISIPFFQKNNLFYYSPFNIIFINIPKKERPSILQIDTPI